MRIPDAIGSAHSLYSINDFLAKLLLQGIISILFLSVLFEEVLIIEGAWHVYLDLVLVWCGEFTIVTLDKGHVVSVVLL